MLAWHGMAWHRLLLFTIEMFCYRAGKGGGEAFLQSQEGILTLLNCLLGFYGMEKA